MQRQIQSPEWDFCLYGCGPLGWGPLGTGAGRLSSTAILVKVSLHYSLVSLDPGMLNHGNVYFSAGFDFAQQVDEQMLNVQNKNSSYIVEWFPNSCAGAALVNFAGVLAVVDPSLLLWQVMGRNRPDTSSSSSPCGTAVTL